MIAARLVQYPVPAHVSLHEQVIVVFKQVLRIDKTPIKHPYFFVHISNPTGS